MVQGHLLNHNLGGPGNDMKNLTPLTTSANHWHEVLVEHTVKDEVDNQNHIVLYNVVADYSTNPTGNDLLGGTGAPAGIIHDIDTYYAPKIAHRIIAEYAVYDAVTHQPVRDANGNHKQDSWEIDNIRG